MAKIQFLWRNYKKCRLHGPHGPHGEPAYGFQVIINSGVVVIQCGMQANVYVQLCTYDRLALYTAMQAMRCKMYTESDSALN